MDSLCVCPEQVDEAVHQVEKTLEFLKSQLKQTIVSVTVWDKSAKPGYLRQDRVCPCDETRTAGELRLLKAILPQLLQDNLHRHLVDKNFYSDKDDFTVVLQNAPVSADLPGLQPTEEQLKPDDKNFRIPCPTEVRPYLRTERNSPSESYSTPVTDPAGNGVGAAPNNLLQVLVQYRGLSWSVGGDKNLSHVTTLPNILKEFNANVTGFSEDKGKETSTQAFLNQAVAGAKANIFHLTQRINFHTDWKVITMFIGGNDLCDACQNALYHSAENFEKRIKEALDYLHKEVPRAIVNLIEPLHILPLRRLHQDHSIKCPTWLVDILCPCVITPHQNSEAERRLDDLNRHYQDGRPDRSYFTPDCFHLSQKSHTQMARALWNNMLEPLGSKTDSQDFSNGLELKCPTQSSPFIRTYKNSNYTYRGPKPTPPPVEDWGRDFSCKDVAPSASVPTSDILKNFNPSIQGFSKGQGSLQKGFNMATSGAQALEKCPCVVLPEEQSPDLMELKRVNVEYQAALEQLVSGRRYDEREDFAVVLQPFLQHAILPLVKEGQPDLSYFSLDCVHLSEKTHSEMATALWNNMLEPVGRKQFFTNFTYDRTKIRCPSEAQPFIFTRHNSQPSPGPTTTPAPTTTAVETTTTIITTGAPVPLCPVSVPVWVPVILAIIGLLIGWAVTWMVFARRQGRLQRRMKQNMEKQWNNTHKKETGL
ncbi:hypothetical protein ACEWY4_022399 [Coilia grayii]|uniref:Phospholipase B1, membrane-associated n=1 Tax=Coilia grayii TaxID=363190 RepID=A0ABD1J984_9TELE